MDIDLSYFAETSDNNKIVVDKLAYIVDVTASQKPYYSILYHPIDSDEEYIGYGSYSQFFVKEWAEKNFVVKNNR